MTPIQLAALRRTVERLGYELKPIREPKPKGDPEVAARIKRIQGMTFKTPAVKSSLLRTLKNVQKHGYSNDRYGFTPC